MQAAGEEQEGQRPVHQRRGQVDGAEQVLRETRGS